VPDVQAAAHLRAELGFFLAGSGLPLLGFPDWETLPYDVFSPLPELVSERLLTLHRLPGLDKGVLVVPVGTLMQRLPPREYVDGQSLVLAVGDRLDLDATRRRLERAGYSCVSQVIGHGEYAVRGSLLDVFPMGSEVPLRIDLFDQEVETIRTFDPETQRSQEKLERVRMLPAREFPLTEEAISGFRQRYRASFEGDPQASLVYREVSEGRTPGGLEYYLPLFFETTATLFDYLPAGVLALESEPAARPRRPSSPASPSATSSAVTTSSVRSCRRPSSICIPTRWPGRSTGCRASSISHPRCRIGARGMRRSTTSRPPPCPRWPSRRARRNPRKPCRTS
jgi:transcription-repair coupling factor (superfamily II helicase)